MTEITTKEHQELANKFKKLVSIYLENRDLVTFELASVIDLAGVRIPKRQCTRILFPSIGTFL